MWTLIIALLGILVAVYWYFLKKENEYFPKNGIKNLPTYIPMIGNAVMLLLKKEHFIQYLERLYKTFPEEKYFGVMSIGRASVMLKDLDIIKQITIKDFDHFLDHAGQVSYDVDPLFGSTLVAMTGQKWRDMRATLSPAFTSSKMRGMFQFITECGEQMAKYYLKEAEKPEYKDKKYMELELKDAFTRYTNDVIATCAFGINVNSFEDKENEFFMKGKESTNFTGIQFLKMLIMMCVPRVMKIFNIRIMKESISNFFRNLVHDTMKIREEKNIIRPDMIHLLMEAKKGSLKHDTNTAENDKEAGFATVEELDIMKQNNKIVWSDDEIVAQAIIFFLAGFDTSSRLLCFMVYELVKNPDIQKRLQEEIDEVAERNNGNVKYEDLPKMKYMDMVVSETLRFWPPGVATDRKCVKPYTLPPSNNSSPGGKLNVGDGVTIPIYSIHHDPQYYKDPEKFDPERFSDENKHEINVSAYMPFGIGPRNCIGSRFALMEIKSIIFHLLLNFNIVPSEKTVIPLKIEKTEFNLMPKEGFWVGFTPRHKK